MNVDGVTLEGVGLGRAVDRPVLRYHGGKWMLAPWVISNFPPHKIYCEPYGGGASVLLRKKRAYSEIYNDLDGEVVNVFKVLRDTPQALFDRLTLTPYSRAEYRRSFELSDDPVEQAARTITRSLMGFGSNSIRRDVCSGFRANAHRSGTTPAHDWKHYPRNVRHFARRLRGVVIENRPALKVIAQQDSPDTLFYVDPPYVHSTRGDARGKGYKHEMTNRQHVRLARRLHECEGMVVVSGYHSKLYDRLYGDWERREREAMADGARPRVEVLYFNPLCSRELLKHATPLLDLCT